jgi:hypothetical protein
MFRSLRSLIDLPNSRFRLKEHEELLQTSPFVSMEPDPISTDIYSLHMPLNSYDSQTYQNLSILPAGLDYFFTHGVLHFILTHTTTDALTIRIKVSV